MFNVPTCVREKLGFQVWDMGFPKRWLYETCSQLKMSVCIERSLSYDMSDQALKLISLSHISGSWRLGVLQR